MNPQEEFESFKAKTHDFVAKGMLHPGEAVGDIMDRAEELGVEHVPTQEDYDALGDFNTEREDRRAAISDAEKKYGKPHSELRVSREARMFIDRNFVDRRNARLNGKNN